MIKGLFKYDGCRIDVKLNKDAYRQNEPVYGKLFLKFNKSPHKVKSINVILVMNYFTESRSKEEKVVSKTIIHKGFNTFPFEEKEIPFTYFFPMNIPLTTNSLIYSIYFEVEYDKILSEKCQRTVHILPSVEFQMLLDIMVSDLNFVTSYRSGLYLNQRQIFEFHPKNQFLQRGLNEVIVVIQYDEFFYKLDFYYLIHNQKFSNSTTIYKSNLYKFNGELNRSEISKNIYNTIDSQMRQLNL